MVTGVEVELDAKPCLEASQGAQCARPGLVLLGHITHDVEPVTCSKSLSNAVQDETIVGGR